MKRIKMNIQKNKIAIIGVITLLLFLVTACLIIEAVIDQML